MFKHQLTKDSDLFLIQPQHAEDLYRLIDDNREYLSRWVSWPEQYHSAKDVHAFIRDCLYRFAEDGNPLCGITYQGGLAGTVDMMDIDWSTRTTSIGYWLGEEFQSKGLVTRAAEILINHGFSCLDMNRIELTTMPENSRSRSVAERLGFQHEGTFCQYTKAQDEFRGREIYGLIKGDRQFNYEPLRFSYSINHDLELRLLQPYDANALCELISKNQEHLGPWLAWANGKCSIEGSRSFIKNTIRHIADNTKLNWGIWYQGKLAGIIATLTVNWKSEKAEVIYWLGAEFQGKGLINSAGRIMINYLFNNLKLNRIELRIATVNTRSKKTADRLGFRHEATLRLAEVVNGKLVDLDCYALLRSDWEKLD